MKYGKQVSSRLPAQQITCDGQQLTIRTNNNNSSMNGGFSAAQIVAGGTGHLIPTSFSFSAFDVTTQMPLFSDTQVKGNGNANHTQQTVKCTQAMTGTLADVLGPVPGVSSTDIVTATFTVTAVHRRAPPCTAHSPARARAVCAGRAQAAHRARASRPS